jgi:hypothetical protein
MDPIDRRLQRYLETEALLNTFFAALDYCRSRCLPALRRAGGGRAVAACCQDRYYARCDLDHPAFVRLRQAREALYGRPQDQRRRDPVSPCEYHDPWHGCALATHKSPTCLAFLCPEGIDHLRTAFGVFTYDYAGVGGALEWILTGDLPQAAYGELQAGIRAMTARIREAGRPCVTGG